jgi:hypothetical protein
MIEPIMYVGMGASLLVIAVIMQVHERAVRLTIRRLQAVTPMATAEILTETETRRRNALKTMRIEKNLIELRQSQEERAKLQREVDSMKRDIESTWAAERMENAVLRERINDVAAEITHFTSVLPGPSSPIEAILAGDAGRTRAPAATNGFIQEHIAPLAANGESARVTLTNRIRALQSRSSPASMVGPPSVRQPSDHQPC